MQQSLVVFKNLQVNLEDEESKQVDFADKKMICDLYKPKLEELHHLNHDLKASLKKVIDFGLVMKGEPKFAGVQYEVPSDQPAKTESVLITNYFSHRKNEADQKKDTVDGDGSLEAPLKRTKME